MQITTYRSRNVRSRIAAFSAPFLVLALGLLSAGPAHANSLPDGYPRLGEESEAVDGYRLTTEGDVGVMTRLFPVFFENTDAPELTYCVEITVPVQYGESLDVIDWASFPGNNNFQENAEQVTWIVYNSYPEISLERFAEEVGVEGLTQEEAITGTQAAIWTLTESDADYRGYEGVTDDVEAGVEERIGDVVDYLLGDANTGLPETQEPSVSIAPENQDGQAGELVGPVTITASADTVALEVTSDYDLVTRDGEQIELDAAPTDTELFLDVPEDAAAGQATLTASLEGPVSTGMLLTPQERGQTLMVADVTNATTVTAQSTLTWAAVPRIATQAADGADGDEYLAQDGPVTVVDTVSYEGLVPGTEYEVRGELMEHDGEDGTATGITASTTFTPDEPSGTVELTFEVPSDALHGAQIVVFESLYTDGTRVAVHADIDDANQTVYRPAIGTQAYDKGDDDQRLASDGGTLSDDIAYSGLRAGETYVLRGELMDRATGESTGITSEARFTAESSSGVETVDFEVPEGHAGTTLVVFERLYLDREGEDEVLLATHEDLEDANQTVVVEDGGELPTDETAAPTDAPTTPTDSPTTPTDAPATGGTLPNTGVNDAPLAVAGALVLLMLGAGLVARRKIVPTH